MLLQNLYCRYLYILIKLPHLLDLEQKIRSFLNCDNYGSLTATNTDPLLDDTPTNDKELHQVICNTFKINYFQEMDTIIKLRNRLECKINYTVRHNLAVHCWVTPFIIRQPIQRPCLLERVYKPMRTLH